MIRERARYRRLIAVLASSIILSLHPYAGRAFADAAGARKRAALLHVRRLLVVPPFFAEDPKDKRQASSDSPAPPGGNRQLPTPVEGGPPAPPTVTVTTEQLQKLEEHARARLPARIHARTSFLVIPEADLTAALKDLHITPRNLFKDKGRIKGGKYAAPDPDVVRKLMARLNADALVQAEMDEPKRTYAHIVVNAGGLDAEPAHVTSRIAFFVLLPDGSEVLHSFVEALAPLTTGASRDYLIQDWTDVLDQGIEEFMDEFTRYTPGAP